VRTPLLLATGIAGVVGVLMTGNTGAHAAGSAAGVTGVIEATYPCQMAMQDLEFLPAPVDVEVVARLDLPAAVTPGQRIVPTGELEVTLPAERGLLLSLTASSVTATSSMVRLDASAGAGTTVLPTTWESDQTPTSAGALTLSGPISFPGYVVPESASARFGLSSAEDQAAILGADQVSLNLELTGVGRLGGVTTYFLSCRAPERRTAGEARLDVVAAAAPSGGPTPAPAPGPMPAPVTEAPPPPARVIAVVPDVAPPPREVPIAPRSSAFAPSLDLAEWIVAAGPPADGVELSPRTLGLVTLLLVGLALASTVWSEARLRALRAAARQTM